MIEWLYLFFYRWLKESKNENVYVMERIKKFVVISFVCKEFLVYGWFRNDNCLFGEL